MGNKETLEHLAENCNGMARKRMYELLKDIGEGTEWMKEIISRRKQRGKEEIEL